MTHTRLAIVLSFLLLPLAAPTARAQQAHEGPRLHVGGSDVTLDGRVQTLFDTSSGDSVVPSQIRMRRVRLGATVRLNDLVTGKIQTEFAGDRVALKDTYVKLTVSPAFEILAGNAWRPFSRLAAETSSTRILPIERGLAIRGVSGMEEQAFVNSLSYTERDIGLQVMGAPKGPLGIQYAAGVFNGPLSGKVGPQDSYQYVGRLSVTPRKDLSVGAAFSSRDFADPAPESPRPDLRRGTAWEVDLEIGNFDPGFHLLAEAAVGAADPFAGRDFRGAAAWLAYRTHPLSTGISALEPTFRASTGDLDGPLAPLGGTLLTPGVNLYFGGNNRLMLNLDLWNPAGSAEREHSFKAMAQVAF